MKCNQSKNNMQNIFYCSDLNLKQEYKSQRPLQDECVHYLHQRSPLLAYFSKCVTKLPKLLSLHLNISEKILLFFAKLFDKFFELYGESVGTFTSYIFAWCIHIPITISQTL